jgi:hypothetical protein
MKGVPSFIVKKNELEVVGTVLKNKLINRNMGFVIL